MKGLLWWVVATCDAPRLRVLDDLICRVCMTHLRTWSLMPSGWSGFMSAEVCGVTARAATI